MGRVIKFSNAFPVADLSEYKIDDSGRLNELKVHPHQQEFFDAMVASVDFDGVIHPVCIHDRLDGTHIRLGGTRLLACRELGVTHLPAYVLCEDSDYTDLRTVDKPKDSHERYEGDFYWHKEESWLEIKASVGL